MIFYLRLLTASCLATLLAACASSPWSNTGELPRALDASLEQLLQQASQTQNSKKGTLHRLLAADLTMRKKNDQCATQILPRLPLNHLKPAQQGLASILVAELAMSCNNPEVALAALNHSSVPRTSELPNDLQVRAYAVYARALEAEGQTLAAAHKRAAMSPILTGDAANINNEAIWSLVAALPVDQLRTQKNDMVGGWMHLALAVKSTDSLPNQQNAIDQWRAQNPKHPAAIQLPDQLIKLKELASQPLTKIAVLLPQDGRLAAIGKALRDGFMTAHYQAQQTGATLPSIQFYDSARLTSLNNFYRIAQADGVQLVVGPLEKSLVNQLNVRPQLPITTLALNYSEGAQGPEELFQLGLAAEDEAREVARRARADGLTQAGAIVPKGEWGERVLSAFCQEWVAHGGSIAGIKYTEEAVDPVQQVGDLVRLRKSVDKPMQFLFLAATPQKAQQIKATLDYQYAGDLPVYATSHVFSASGNQKQYKDMNGIRFCETPWLLEPGSLLSQKVATQWPQASSSLGRLYAMSFDAYTLTSRLGQLKVLPNRRIAGLSGSLGMSPSQHIERRLPWAKFVNGQVQRLPEKSN